MHNSHADIGQINFLSYLTGAQARPLCRARDVSLDRRLAPAQHVKKLKKNRLSSTGCRRDLWLRITFAAYSLLHDAPCGLAVPCPAVLFL